MSYSFGGLIIKKARNVSEKNVLSLLKNETVSHKQDVTVTEATSSEFEGIGFTRWNDTVLVFGRDIPYSCSFDPNEPSKLNDRLKEFADSREIVCYHLNGIAESYAFALFKDSEFTRAKSVSGGEKLSDFGKKTAYEDNDGMNESFMLKFLDNFLNTPFIELLNEGKQIVKVFK